MSTCQDCGVPLLSSKRKRCPICSVSNARARRIARGPSPEEPHARQKPKRRGARRVAGAWDISGCVFGPLRVLCRSARRQLAGILWEYFCEACGYRGDRLGTKFLNTAAAGRCPACKEWQRPPPRDRLAPDRDTLRAAAKRNRERLRVVPRRRPRAPRPSCPTCGRRWS